VARLTKSDIGPWDNYFDGTRCDQRTCGEALVKILVLTSLYPNKAMPVYGTFSRERVRHLKDRCEIRVVAPVRYDFFHGHHNHIPQVEHDDGIAVHHPRFFNIPKFMKWSDAFLFAICILPAVIKIKNTFDPDLIDAHWGYPDGMAAFLIGKLLNLPVVVTLLGSDVNVFMRGAGRGWLLRWYLKRMHKIIVVSEGNLRTRNHQRHRHVESAIADAEVGGREIHG